MMTISPTIRPDLIKPIGGEQVTSASHPQVHMPHEIPRLQWSRRFPGTAASPSAARHWLQGLLPPCEAQDDLVTIAGELTANAVTHTRSGLPDGTFRIDISWTPELIRLVVGDDGASKPPRLITDSESTTGRGLLLVNGMARQWGVVGGEGGRRVWADIPQTPAVDPVDAVLAVIHHEHPEVSAWYGALTQQWWALVGYGPAAGLISAESASQLTSMLNDENREPSSGFLPDAQHRTGERRHA